MGGRVIDKKVGEMLLRKVGGEELVRRSLGVTVSPGVVIDKPIKGFEVPKGISTPATSAVSFDLGIGASAKRFADLIPPSENFSLQSLCFELLPTAQNLVAILPVVALPILGALLFATSIGRIIDVSREEVKKQAEKFVSGIFDDRVSRPLFKQATGLSLAVVRQEIINGEPFERLVELFVTHFNQLYQDLYLARETYEGDIQFLNDETLVARMAVLNGFLLSVDPNPLIKQILESYDPGVAGNLGSAKELLRDLLSRASDQMQITIFMCDRSLKIMADAARDILKQVAIQGAGFADLKVGLDELQKLAESHMEFLSEFRWLNTQYSTLALALFGKYSSDDTVSSYHRFNVLLHYLNNKHGAAELFLLFYKRLEPVPEKVMSAVNRLASYISLGDHKQFEFFFDRLRKNEWNVTEQAKTFLLRPENEWFFPIVENIVNNSERDGRLKDRIFEGVIGSYEKDGSVVVYINNNGPGIPNEVQKKLLIQQVHGDPEKQGSGVGLLSAKQDIESKGGKIWFESKEGEDGVTFFISIPIQKP